MEGDRMSDNDRTCEVIKLARVAERLKEEAMNAC